MAKYNSEEEARANYEPSKEYILPKGYTADIAIFTLIPNEEYRPKDEKSTKYKLAIMMIQRALYDEKGEPNKEGGKWALPGGYTQYQEDQGSAFNAAVRELEEETNVDGIHLKHFGTYDKVGRDKWGWIITNAHYAIVPESKLREREAADDASRVELYTVDEVFKLDLAFDHQEIIQDAITAVQDDMFETTVAKNFLPKEFKLEDLRHVLMAVIDSPTVNRKAAFFRKAPRLSFIEEVVDDKGQPILTETTKENKRPAKLYRFVSTKVRASIWD